MNHPNVDGNTARHLTESGPPKPRRASPRWNILIRRLHLYAGLFLLPWVFLYGITGAMFNHQGLLSETRTVKVPAENLANSALKAFPRPEELAIQVVQGIEEAVPDTAIELENDHHAEFNNEVILEVRSSGAKHAVHIDPVTRSARVVEFPEPEHQESLLNEVKNIRLHEDPYKLANSAVPQIMADAGFESNGSVHPRGWCKLNFLASIDGQPARVTYVLRDGHVDITKFDGSDGMTSRQFFLRLHTSHGQPPHWNARMIWSLFLDAMAIAMVTWGVTGLVMWWQLKRARLLGAAVIGASLVTAISLYFGMTAFYATTRM